MLYYPFISKHTLQELYISNKTDCFSYYIFAPPIYINRLDLSEKHEVLTSCSVCTSQWAITMPGLWTELDWTLDSRPFYLCTERKRANCIIIH